MNSKEVLDEAVKLTMTLKNDGEQFETACKKAGNKYGIAWYKIARDISKRRKRNNINKTSKLKFKHKLDIDNEE